jgi:hypothetical protein
MYLLMNECIFNYCVLIINVSLMNPPHMIEYDYMTNLRHVLAEYVVLNVNGHTDTGWPPSRRFPTCTECCLIDMPGKASGECVTTKWSESGSCQLFRFASCQLTIGHEPEEKHYGFKIKPNQSTTKHLPQSIPSGLDVQARWLEDEIPALLIAERISQELHLFVFIKALVQISSFGPGRPGLN